MKKYVRIPKINLFVDLSTLDNFQQIWRGGTCGYFIQKEKQTETNAHTPEHEE